MSNPWSDLTKDELIERVRNQRVIIEQLAKGQAQVGIQEIDGAKTIIAMIDQSKYTPANNRFKELLKELEDRVEFMINNRHDYPMWPMVDGPMDEFDSMYHQPIRQVYYAQTVYLIQVLRKMRRIG